MGGLFFNASISQRPTFGVLPLGGSHPVPPKGGTPNAIFRHALKDGLYLFRVLSPFLPEVRQVFRQAELMVEDAADRLFLSRVLLAGWMAFQDWPPEVAQPDARIEAAA